ncbi:MAG: hypothetical protein JKY70_03870 [Mucilaginibacter sp.]|nr:hypothetical protein [Mucilaginibacter sp.]
MEMGYSSLDLVMLLIAALVIWAASRVPVRKDETHRRVMRSRLKSKHQHSHSL